VYFRDGAVDAWFAKLMVALAEVLGVVLTEQRHRLYAKLLGDVPPDQLRVAFGRAANACRGGCFPSPGELRGFLGPAEGDAALLAWAALVVMIYKLRSHRNLHGRARFAGMIDLGRKGFLGGGDDGIVVEFPPSAERVAALVEERDAAVTRAEAAERERDIAIAGGAARIEGAAARIDAIAREGNPYGESLVDDDDPLRMTRWQGWDDGWLGAHIEDERDRLRAERDAAVARERAAPVAGEGEEAVAPSLDQRDAAALVEMKRGHATNCALSRLIGDRCMCASYTGGMRSHTPHCTCGADVELMGR